MTWWILFVVVGLLLMGGLVYWHLVLAEGAYLGPRMVARTYDWVAHRYDAIKQFDPRDEDWFVAGPVLQGLAGVDRPLLLDVATGTGRVPLALLRNRFGATGGRIVGLDLSWGMLRQARAKLHDFEGKVDLVWQDASHLPFDDETFDAVTCMEALEFLPRPRETLAEMVRVLRPGGLLAVTNRVGYGAHLLPGRAITRPLFQQALAALPLCQIETRRWQVDYDLISAHKGGDLAPTGRGDGSLASLLRCPACREPLRQQAARIVCPGCERVFPIHDRIVAMAADTRNITGKIVYL
jgi:ubiquinone/menaquinone biosynthesis C-methylase UbiE/uncharacterized protein YbaR (Trm112 family)